MRLRTKLAALAVTAGVAVAATGAYAYWSTTGSGSGSATVADSNGTVTLHGIIGSGADPSADPPVAGHAPFPGGSNPVTFTADNAGATDLRVATIHLDSVEVDSGHSGCDVADFSMSDVNSNTTVLHGASGQAISGVGALVFANDPVNSQNDCKGATITLQLSSN